MIRLVVYTVLVGEKEALNDPLQYVGHEGATDLSIDFICFTDNPSLTSPTWTFRDIPNRLIPPNRLSRLPKALPHEFFPDYDYSLYIDNTVAFKRLPRCSDLGLDSGAVFRAFRHPWRSCPQDEADVVVRSGLDDAALVAAQTRYYDGHRSLRQIPTLTAGTALLRRHHDPRVRTFGRLWWEQILLFSSRDQISLDQCIREVSCPIDYFPGDKTNSDLVAWPALAAPRRVEATFDADRYAWEHRHDPEARAHPRTHYLTHGGHLKYERRPAWFSYCCARTGSGFGSQAAPRRCLADIIEPLLQEMVDAPGGILIVGVASTESYAAAPEELASAQEALKLYFRFNHGSEIMAAAVSDDDVADPAPFRGAYGWTGFRLVIVIGLTPAHHANALSKFVPLLAENGTLLVQFGESLSTGDIRRMEDGLEESYTLSIFHGGHISQANAVPSSVFTARRSQHRVSTLP